MTKSSVSKEKMQKWVDKEIIYLKACIPMDFDKQMKILQAIRALIEHGPEVSRECIEYLTKIEKRTRDIIEWLEEPWDDPNAVIDEMTIRLKRLLQDTMGRR